MKQDDIKKDAMRRYTQAMCLVEVELFNARQSWIAEDKLSAWFQSTPTKAAFGRLMTYASLVTECYTNSDIAEKLNISRMSANRLTKDASDAGWVKVCRHGKETTSYSASSDLVKSTTGYAEYLLDLLIKHDTLEAENLVWALKNHGYM